MANGNGNAMLKWVVGILVGVSTSVTLGVTGFLAVQWAEGVNDEIGIHREVLATRGERIAILESRTLAMDQTTASGLASIDRRLQNIERWQEEMRDVIADLKANNRKSSP